MRRRRLLAAVAVLAVIGGVILLDMKILTLPGLSRRRAEQVLVGIFRYPLSFREPVADLRGTLRLRHFRLEPPHRRYSIGARELEMGLDISEIVRRQGPIRQVRFREMTLRWDREPGEPWDLAPFLAFCGALQASPIALVRIDDLSLVIGKDAAENPRHLPIDWVELEPREDGVHIRGWSTQPPWGRLQFELVAIRGTSEITGWIRLRNLLIRPQDIPWLPEPAAGILSALRPRGTGDVRIGIGKGREVEVRVQPVNLSLRPESFPYPIRKITGGTVVATSTGIRIDGLERRSGRTRFVASGLFPLPGAEGDQALDLSFEDLHLDDTLAAALVEDLGWVWDRTEPSGIIGGHLTLRPSAGRFGGVDGRIRLDPMQLSLPLATTLKGEASIRQEGSMLIAGIDGVLLDVGGLSLGRIAEGDLIVRDDLYQLRAPRGDSSPGGFSVRFRQQREWPYEWAGSLCLSRSDLGEILTAITGEEGPRGGDWALWLQASRGLGDGEGDGSASFFAAEGREMALIKEVFPPRTGEPSRVRGELCLQVRDDAIRIVRLVLESGPHRAIGEGEILAGGRFRLSLLRRSAPGRGGPREDGAPGAGPLPAMEAGAARIILEGTGPSHRVSVYPVGSRGGG